MRITKVGACKVFGCVWSFILLLLLPTALEGATTGELAEAGVCLSFECPRSTPEASASQKQCVREVKGTVRGSGGHLFALLEMNFTPRKGGAV